MENRENVNQKSNIIIYTTEDGLTKIETTFDEDTVWLSIDQMAELFQRDKSTILSPRKRQQSRQIIQSCTMHSAACRKKSVSRSHSII